MAEGLDRLMGKAIDFVVSPLGSLIGGKAGKLITAARLASLPTSLKVEPTRTAAHRLVTPAPTVKST